MKNRNENQSKHVANSLRIIGMTQFAAFGYPALLKGDIYGVVVSSVAYAISEVVAYRSLRK